MTNSTQQPESIVIVGGGTAGWMCAAYLAAKWSKRYRITLIESAQIGTVGVGEGSTPFLKQFFAELGWQESDWMPACDATYKTGIEFSNWTSNERFKRYFHPFFSALDLDTAEHFFANCNQLRKGKNAAVRPAQFFSAATMAEAAVTPVSTTLGGDIDYAYHFDASKLASCLLNFAVQQGVTHLTGNVLNVQCTNGHITQLETDCSDPLTATLFIDCSGFRGLLMKQGLGQPLQSYQDCLFNDRAVAIPTPHSQPHQAITPQTRSEGLSCGWMWNIPLTSRVGNGYVYSSQFCSPEEAEAELRQRLRVSDETPARHLTMPVGRLQEHWRSNCVAIGLAQGFIEPLEATALMLVQYGIYQLSSRLGEPLTTESRSQYNTEMNRMFDGIRDYIVAHYYLNTRTDTPYWQACRHDIRVPENLSLLVNAWDGPGEFEEALDSIDEQLVYLRPSWYCILAGMGRFKSAAVNLPDPGAAADIQQYLTRTVGDHFKTQLLTSG